MKNKSLFITLAFLIIAMSPLAQETGADRDTRDAKTDKSLKIGTQTWAAKNLSVSKFRNGDAIPQAKTDDEWVKAGTSGTPAWCCFKNDPANDKKYGKLYNWYAVIDPRGLAPEGWHVPSNEEWTMLENYLGGTKKAGGILKAKTSWISPNIGAKDSVGFRAYGCGLRDYDGTWNDFGSSCNFWSVSEGGTERAWDRLLLYSGTYIRSSMDFKANGLSVRCLKD